MLTITSHLIPEAMLILSSSLPMLCSAACPSNTTVAVAGGECGASHYGTCAVTTQCTHPIGSPSDCSHRAGGACLQHAGVDYVPCRHHAWHVFGVTVAQATNGHASAQTWAMWGPPCSTGMWISPERSATVRKPHVLTCQSSIAALLRPRTPTTCINNRQAFSYQSAFHGKTPDSQKQPDVKCSCTGPPGIGCLVASCTRPSIS